MQALMAFRSYFGEVTPPSGAFQGHTRFQIEVLYYNYTHNPVTQLQF